MFGALIRAAERWRSVKVTEFERRQLRFNSSNVGDKPTSMPNCARLNNSTRL
jgi:hypothetical protein